MTQQKKVGLALGSGSSRGWSHIGVIKALMDNDIPVDFVAGTSIGAYVGAIFASGHLEEFHQTVLEMDWKRVVSMLDLSMSLTGVLEGRKVMDLAGEVMTIRNFKDLKIPLRVVAADLKTGEEIIFSEGSVKDAVRASISIPGIFRPVEINKRVCVDGGLLNPVPVDIVKEMGADVVIAVDLNHCLINRHEKKKKTRLDEKRDKALNKAIFEKFSDHFNSVESLIQSWFKFETGAIDKKEEIPGFLDVYRQSVDIMEMQISNLGLRLNPADILINPDLGHIKLMDFDLGKEIISEGYQKTMDKMDDIKQIVNSK